MLPKSIKKNSEFKNVYKHGRKIVTKFFIFYYVKNGLNNDRIGFTVSSKIGKSTVRNRIRRRLREVFRLKYDEDNKGYDFVIVARNRMKNSSYQNVEKELIKTYDKFRRKIK